MVDKLTIDFSSPQPLFPLPRCVLLPHATIPLHIFEDRYRKMIHDALDSHGLIAMSLFEGDTWKQDYEGSPPLRPHVCVGYIVKHERLAGGRYNLLLQGICRAAIRHEVKYDGPYRKALLRPTETHTPMEIDLEESRQRIESLLNHPLLKELASISAIHNWLSAEIPTPALVDLAIMTICHHFEQRYTMLAEPDACKRADWLDRLLQDTRHTLTVAERFRHEQPADGLYLN